MAVGCTGLRGITLVVENQMEREIENKMESDVSLGVVQTSLVSRE